MSSAANYNLTRIECTSKDKIHNVILHGNQLFTKLVLASTHPYKSRSYRKKPGGAF